MARCISGIVGGSGCVASTIRNLVTGLALQADVTEGGRWMANPHSKRTGVKKVVRDVEIDFCAPTFW